MDRIHQVNRCLVRGISSATKTWKAYDDGFVIQQMQKEDIPTVNRWCESFHVPKRSLEIAYNTFGDSGHYHFGVYKGQPVASHMLFPWTKNYCIGGFFFVEEEYRKIHSFGKRLWQYVIEKFDDKDMCLCGVSVLPGQEIRKKSSTLMLQEDFEINIFELALVPKFTNVNCSSQSVKIIPAQQVPFDAIIEFDNQSFLFPNNQFRKDFLLQWFNTEDGKTYVAVDDSNRVVGFASRQCVQESPLCFDIGPLYAMTSQIAQDLLSRHLIDITGTKVQLCVPASNNEAVKLMHAMDFRPVGTDACASYVGGRRHPLPHPHVFALTQDEICGA